MAPIEWDAELARPVVEGRVFDPSTFSWIAAPEGAGGGMVSAAESLRRLAAAGPIRRVPVGVIGPREAEPHQAHTAEKLGRALALHRHLLRARRLRRRRFGRKPRGAKIPLARTIAQRPAEIDRRQEIGHREADLLIFRRAHGQANVTSLVERQSRRLRLIPNSDRRSQSVVGAIGDALAALSPAARRTVTFDRGSGFLGYDHLARAHGIVASFCDPHSPWQKGSVENTNGRLRRYLPGELDLANISPTYLCEIESRMNSTPRKCLGFRTLQEAFAAAARVEASGERWAVPERLLTSIDVFPPGSALEAVQRIELLHMGGFLVARLHALLGRLLCRHARRGQGNRHRGRRAGEADRFQEIPTLDR